MLVDSLTSPAQEISPEQGWTLLNEVPGTKLVDVRTIPEWLYVGVPDVQSTPGTLLQISWHAFIMLYMHVLTPAIFHLRLRGHVVSFVAERSRRPLSTSVASGPSAASAAPQELGAHYSSHRDPLH
jgi:hypothetical protein